MRVEHASRGRAWHPSGGADTVSGWKRSCARMLALMAGVGPERIPRYLPFNPYGRELVRRGLAEPREWVQVAGKTGRLLGVAGHVVAVWSQDVELVLAVMASESPDPGFGVDHPQMLAIARV